MTIGNKIYSLSAALLTLNAAIGLVGLMELRTLGAASTTLTENTVPSVYIAGRINTGAKAILLRIHRHFTATSPATLDSLESYLNERNKSVRQEIASYEKLKLKDKERETVGRIHQDLDALIAIWQEVRPVSRAGDKAKAVAMFEKDGVRLAEDLDTLAKNLVASNKAVSDEIGRENTAYVQRATLQTWLIFLVSLVAGVVMAVVLTRNFNRKLLETVHEVTEGSEQVLAASNMIASSSQNLAEEAQQHAAALEETSAAEHEITSTAGQNVKACDTATKLLQQSEARFDDAQKSMHELVVAVRQIEDSSSRVGQIIRTIDEIAFQTNILALNAAVEAARAGEAGMGFAVVADEVRNLAQRSAEAARNTSTLIDESIARSRGGTEKMQRVETSISSFGEMNREISVLIHQVSTASREQATGMAQVSQAMNRLESHTQSSAAHAEESAAAAHELSNQATRLKGAVLHLSEMVEG